MTLIEIVIVVVIIAIGASGLSFSLGALTRTHLKSAAAKLSAASRYAYNRAIIRGKTVRISFNVPGNEFSIEEAHGSVTLARADDERRTMADEEGQEVVAADPWQAAASRIDEALKPSLGGSPFAPLKGTDGSALKRYQKVSLGRRVQLVRLIVAHRPEPLEEGSGAVHFFPGGMGEHAVIHLSDGSSSVFSLEIFPLTGRTRVYPEAYEPRHLLGDPEDPEYGEVDE